MVFFWIGLILGLALLALLLYTKLQGKNIIQVFIKAGVSVCFMIMGISGVSTIPADASGRAFGYMVLVGLLFALLGDIWLDLKLIHRKYEDIYTMAGFISFLACQIMFVLGLIIFYAKEVSILMIIIPIIVAVGLGVALGLLGHLIGLEFGNFRNIVIIYSSALLMTVLLSLGLCIGTKFSGTTLILMFIGGLFFLASDLILSQIYFGSKYGDRLFTVINLGTYYVGMFLIAASILGIR